MTSDLRIGFGVDYHQIQKGNSMILGGIKIDCGYSILAHSDGDIILHSICDALLGAASMGDLGTVFKEDESTENISRRDSFSTLHSRIAPIIFIYLA